MFMCATDQRLCVLLAVLAYTVIQRVITPVQQLFILRT